MNAHIPAILLKWLADGHQIRWAHDARALPKGDICFYLSYGKIVNQQTLSRHKNNLVVHASDLPKGRGWSPLTWQIIEGQNRIPITLFEAAETVDSGEIYTKIHLHFDGHELIDELRDAVAQATIRLCWLFVEEYPDIRHKGIPQMGSETYYQRRRPEDSRIDLDRSLREQFNLLRTVDNQNYPAWFDYLGQRFSLKIEEINHSSKQTKSEKEQ